MDYLDEGYVPESLEEAVKYEIWGKIYDYYYDSTNYTQAELAHILEVYPPDVSNLLNGRQDKFSVSKLIRYADKLHLQIKLNVLAPTAKDTQDNLPDNQYSNVVPCK